MTLVARARSFLRALLLRRAVEREIDADLTLHVAERIDDLVTHGVSRADAERQARRELGDPARWRVEGREARGTQYLDDLRADLLYALRWLRQSPAFTATAALSLAMGIGSNAAMFTLIDAVLLRSLPVQHPEELLVYSMESPNGEPARVFSYGMLRQFREDGRRTLAGTIASSAIRFSVDTGGWSDSTASGQMVSGNYYSVLGVPAVVGRPLLPGDEGAPRTGAVAELSYGYWERRFGRDPAVIGRTVTLNGLPFTIVGVSPPGFFGTEVGNSADITVPLSMEPVLMNEPGGGRLREADADLWLSLMARRRPEATELQARAELQAVFQQMIDAWIESAGPKGRVFGPRRLTFESGSRGVSELRRRFSRPLLVLMGAVMLVLLICCANMANLLLARAAARRREVAVRISLGAGRFRLVRQLLTESVLLALLGGGLGLLLAVWTSQSLTPLLAAGQQFALAVHPDARVLAFTFVTSVVTGIVFGLAPAAGVSHLDAAAALKDGGAAVAPGGRRFTFRGALVTTQVAVSAILLVFASLFVRTLMYLHHLDLGMDQEHVLALRLEPAGSNQKRPNEARLRQIYSAVLTRIHEVPGVRAASLSGATPLSNENPLSVEVSIAGYVPHAHEDMHVRLMQVFPGYLDATGVRLRAGRDLQPSDDRADAPSRAVVNETLARRFFGDVGSAIGRTFDLPSGRPAPVVEIVGVSGDTRDHSLREEILPLAYMTYAKTPTGRGQMTLLVRAAGDPRALVSTVRQLAREADPTMPLLEVQSLADRIAAATEQEHLVALLSSLFGAMAVLLAALGLYGVLAYAVASRRMEFGIRLALGATPSRLQRLVLGDSLLLVGVGLVMGLAVSGAAARGVSRMLFGVAPLDTLSFGGTSALLLAVALGAAWLPARHAAGVDPILALRAE